LSQILEEAEHMSALIESLMTQARMDSGAEALTFQRIDIASIVREACERSEPLARLKQIQCDHSIPDGSVFVDADADALRRLFLILLDNAVKYTSSEGRISVVLQTQGSEVSVGISDTGIGIARRHYAVVRPKHQAAALCQIGSSRSVDRESRRRFATRLS
jgi:signal transduction histidine kinase